MANAADNTQGNSQDFLINAAAVQSQRRLQQTDNAGKLEHADLEQSESPVQLNSGLALNSPSLLSRANSAQSLNSSISGESGDKTHRELSVLLDSVKRSATTSNNPDSVTQPPVQQIDQAAESTKLASSLQKENSLSKADDGPKHKTAADLRQSNSKEKEDEKATIEKIVQSNPELVTQLTTNLSITRKSSGTGNAPNTPRAENPITPAKVDEARETLTTSLKQIDEKNTEKFQLAGIGMTIGEVKAIITINKSDTSALKDNETIKNNPDLLTSFRKILRQKS
jgi:hypothetical protein